MKKFSKSVDTFLYWLANNDVSELFSPKTLDVIKDASKASVVSPTSDAHKEYLDNKVLHFKSQLNEGVFTSVSNLISYIKSTTKIINIDSVSYSPLVIAHKELRPCRAMKFFSGNIITGRDKEIDTILLTLCKKSKRGVILVGEPGVGKTALVQAINARLIQRTVPRQLIGCEILEMNVPMIFSQNKEDPIGTIIGILERASSYDKAILFIDEIHQLLGQRMNDILKPYLTEKIRFIGSTTINEYHSIITDDTALERRFTIINVNEPNIEETVNMVLGTKSVFEEQHKCSIPDDACRYLVETASRFLGSRRNPDKSLDVLDIACSIMYENEISVKYRNIETSKDPLKNLEKKRLELSSVTSLVGSRVLNKKYIDLAISNVTGINYDDIANSLEFVAVRDGIKQEIFGQDRQISTLSNVVNIFKHIGHDRVRPVSILLMVGTPGCGKKSSAKALARYLFGSKDCFIDYDMSSYKDGFAITELKGSPPGYVGYGKSGGLIKAIRTKPLSVIYFRGINQAHETITQYLIDGCRTGHLVDSAEREAKLNNSIIIFSVTLPPKEYGEILKGKKKKSMGFGPAEEGEKTDKELLSPIVGENLVTICDEVIFFDELKTEDLEEIYKSNLDYYLKMYKNVGIDLNSLHKEVLNNSKNGHDIISRLSSEVPKQVFKQLTEEKVDDVKKKSIKVSKKNRNNDSQCKK